MNQIKNMKKKILKLPLKDILEYFNEKVDDNNKYNYTLLIIYYYIYIIY